MSTTFVINQTLATETCIKCGVLFAFPLTWQNQFKLDHRQFCCPVGHYQYYSDQSDAEKLRKEVAQLQTVIERKEAREASLLSQRETLKHRCSAIKGHVTRIKKRLQHGVCPCCNRTFQNLLNHMKTEHPTYAATENT